MTVPITLDLVGKVISFNVLPQAVAFLTTNYSLCKVDAIVDWQSCYALGFNVAQIHENIKPLLPIGTGEFDSYQYLKLRLANGEQSVVGLPWIDQGSIVINENSAVNVYITGISLSDIPTIRAALLGIGLTEFKITPA